MQRLEQQLTFLRETDKLKSIYRNTILLDEAQPVQAFGLELAGRHSPTTSQFIDERLENDAEHSWHICVCAMLLREHFDEPGLDFERLLKMLLVHDLVEIYAGDTYAYADTALLDTQHDREAESAAKLFSLLPPDQTTEFRALWDEFEEKKTIEAKTARGIDSFMPFYWNYLTQGKQWLKLGATRDKVLKRCGLIKLGSARLYEFAMQILDESVEKGYLPIE